MTKLLTPVHRELSDRFIPRNQADCDHANALRDYERAHRIWMNTEVGTEAGRLAKAALYAARETYIAATHTAHPTWIIL